MRVRRSTRHGRPPPTLVSTGSTTRGCAGSTGPRCDRALRVIELVEITARGSVQLVDERTRSSDTPAAGPRITIRVRRSTSPLDHPGSLVSTGSTSRGCAGSTGPRCDRPLRVIELVEITARGSVELVAERTRSPDTPAVARESRFGYVDLRDMVDHRPPCSRQARPPEDARARPVRGA